MNRLFHRLAASLLSTMLIVLSPVAQETETIPAAKTNEVTAVAAIEKETPPAAKRSSSSRRRSSSRTTYEDIVMVGGVPVTIKAGETARDVVVVGSNVDVDGSVQGELVVVLGNVRIGPTGKVTDGPVIFGGDLVTEPGAKIGVNPTVLSLAALGGVTNVLNPALVTASKRWVSEGALRIRPLPHALPLAWIVAGFMLGFFVLVGLIFQRPVAASVAILDERPGSALLSGLLVGFFSLLLMLLLVISIVGWVLLPFVVCALAACAIIGKVAVYRYAGQALGSQLGVQFLQNPLIALVAGALIFYLCYAVPVLGAVVWLMVIPLGLGATILATLGRRRSATSATADGVPVDASPGVMTVPPLLLPRVGFWMRFLATFLDFMLVGLVMAFVFPRDPAKWFLLAWSIYHLVLWTWKGTTVGGVIVGLRIVREDGSPINFAVATVRLLGGFFSAALFFLGFFWAGWSADRQSWHDKIAGTVVIRNPKSTPLL